jgi:hypothetical protein
MFSEWTNAVDSVSLFRADKLVRHKRWLMLPNPETPLGTVRIRRIEGGPLTSEDW